MRRPLGSTERLIWEFARIVPIGTTLALRVSGPLSGPLLSRALAHVQARHPLLRARVDDSGRPTFIPEDVPPIPLSVESRRDGAHWLEALETELNQSWPPHTAPLARVRLLSGDDDHDVIIGLHHMIADGTSAIVFGMEFLTRAAELVEGRQTHQEPAPERPSVEDLLPARLRGASGLGRAVRVAGQWGFNAVRGLLSMPAEVQAPPGQRRSRLLRLRLEPDETAVLIQSCRERGTTMHGALCAAMLQAVVEAFRDAPENRGATAIACVSPVDLRRMLHPTIDDEIGMYITPFATAHPLSGIRDFWPLARAVRRDLRAAMESGDVFGPLAAQRVLPPPVLMRERMIRLTERLYPGPLTVTNLGRFDKVEAGPFQVEDVAGAAAINAVGGNGVALATCTYAGIAQFFITYPQPLVSHARAEALAHDTLHRLRAAL